MIEEHRSAFEYDWRTRFGAPLRSVFSGEMNWREAWDLTVELLRDPSSHVAAALAKMTYPFSREAAISADLYDLLVSVNVDPKRRGQVKPYPRPFSRAETKRSTSTASQVDIRKALAARGHGVPNP